MIYHYDKCKTVRGAALWALAFTVLFFAPVRPTAAAPPAMGVNLEGPGDGSVGHLYTDIFRQGRHWGSVAAPWDEVCTEDSNGWPMTDAGIVLLGESNPVVGTYKLTFTGQATLAGNASSFTIANQTYNSGTNITTADINYASGNIMIDFTNTKRTSASGTNTGITNARLIRPGYPADGSVLFTSPFQTELAKFSVIRFMDFSHANGNGEVNWTDRRLPSYSTQVGAGSLGGGAWEYAIALCNAIGKDAYINVPMHATDAYITSLATLFKNGDTVNGVVYPGLNAGLNVYIEYSNEIWNNQFQQTADNHTAAQAEVAAGGSPLNYDGDTDSWDWTRRRTAKRTKEISDLWRAVFGDAAMPGTSATPRIRPVMEWQGQNGQNTGHLQMSFLHNYYNNAEGAYVGTPHPVNYYIYGGGSAPYFNSNNDAATTVDLLYASGIPQTGYSTWLTTDANWSKSFGIKAVDYEGGWNIGTNNSMSATQLAAHDDPRAATAIINASNMFSQAGGDLEIWYASCGPANWVWAMTSDPAVTSQLISGINTLNASTAPAPTNGTTLTTTGTTTIQAASYSVNDQWFGAAGAVPTMGDSNLYKGFFVVSPTAATYQVQLSVASPNTGGKINLYVDSVLSATITVPNTGSASTYANTTQVPITLSAGMHGIVVGAAVNGSSASPFAGNFAALLIGNGTISIPSVPTGLTATGGYQRATLNWSTASGATSYNVYRGTTAGGEAATAVATSIVANTYTDIGLNNGTTYYYKVTAVNSSGESAKSSEASVVPVDNTAHIVNTATAPVIDGTVDAVWSNATSYSVSKLFNGPIPTGQTFSGTWKAMWDNNNLYLLFQITNNETLVSNAASPWQGDDVELYIDATDAKPSTYGNGDFQYELGYGLAAAQETKHSPSSLTGVHYSYKAVSGGWAAEASIPWSTLGVTPSANNLVGFDVDLVDGFNAGSTKLFWWDTDNTDWQNPASFGTGLLQGGGGGAPAAPTGLTATAGNTQVALAWTASTGATSYNVLRSTVNGSGYASVATGIAVTNYTNTGLINGTTYYFVVTATNAGGTSGNSNQASATPQAGVPPAPTGLTATAGNTQVALAWTASTGATSYNVLRSTVNGSGYASVATGIATTSYTNTGLTNGTTYYFVVTATNAGGTSGNSNQASATPTTSVALNRTGWVATASVTSGTFTPNKALDGDVATWWDTGTNQVPGQWFQVDMLTAQSFNQVVLSLPAAPYNYYFPCFYALYVSNDAVNWGSAVATGSQSQPAPTSISFANQTARYFKIQITQNGLFNGNSWIINEVNVYGSAPATPAAPTGLTATPGNAQVALSWTASTGATSYNVLRSTVSGSGYASVATGIATTTYTNTGLTNGMTFYFVVSATNAGGTSANSAQASATPSAGGVTTLGDTDDRDSQSDVPAGTNPTISASQFDQAYFKFTVSGVTGTVTNAKLRVYRSDISKGSLTFNVYRTLNDTWVQSGTVPGLGTVITNVVNGTIGYVEFDVTSFVAGQITGDGIASFGMDSSSGNYTNFSTRENASNQPQLVITTSGGSIPAAPTGLAATGGNAQVALGWTASSGATSYNVKRSTVSGSGYATVSSPATTSYTNTGLTNGTTYYFVVTAVNAVGESGNSNQATGTPGAGTSVKINAAGPLVSPFVADVDFSGGLTATNWTGAIDTSAVTSPAPQAVYQSERYGAMTYTIPGFPSGTSHTVRLHLCENYFTTSGGRVFNVSINGVPALTNFDIYATTGAAHKANVQQFSSTANSSGQYVIVFTNVTNNALVNGIEVN